MTTTISRSALLVGFVLACSQSAAVVAQDIAEITGVLRSAQGNRLEIQAEDRRYTVLIDSHEIQSAGQRTELEFHGQGRGSIIRATWWVRFFADIDASGNVVGPLEKLTWFTPQRNNQEGAFPVEEAEGAEPRIRWDRPLHNEKAAGKYFVVGSIRTLNQGRMLVVFEGGQVVAELSPEIEVEIDITNKVVAGELIKAGDKLEVSGRMIEDKLHALTIVARREEVIGKPLPKPRPSRRAER
jgi:hypothetical protein